MRIEGWIFWKTSDICLQKSGWPLDVNPEPETLNFFPTMSSLFSSSTSSFMKTFVICFTGGIFRQQGSPKCSKVDLQIVGSAKMYQEPFFTCGGPAMLQKRFWRLSQTWVEQMVGECIPFKPEFFLLGIISEGYKEGFNISNSTRVDGG
uniref:Uncharacterized protein n=1 Tax=Micrurus corallinus TaxID=54390 RepID=A0A2D4FA49_MICCO